jgi:tRNA(Ile)-lysidine synthase TilS/MesJ
MVYSYDPSKIDPPIDPPLSSDARATSAANQNSKAMRKNPRPIESLWPDDLVLSDEMRAFAVEYGVDPESEFAAWRDDCAAHDRKYRSWPAAWRNRIRLTLKYGAAKRPNTMPAVAGRARFELPTQHRLSPGMAEGALILAELKAAEDAKRK